MAPPDGLADPEFDSTITRRAQRILRRACNVDAAVDGYEVFEGDEDDMDINGIDIGDCVGKSISSAPTMQPTEPADPTDLGQGSADPTDLGQRSDAPTDLGQGSEAPTDLGQCVFKLSAKIENNKVSLTNDQSNIQLRKEIVTIKESSYKLIKHIGSQRRRC